MRKAIAIDFDGCLCKDAWPEIGAPNWDVIRAARFARQEGAALILWTCRNGDLLDGAVEWCGKHGLIFDAVNENLSERVERYGGESRKVSADEYWDDHAVRKPQKPVPMLTLKQLREMGEEWVWIKLRDQRYGITSGYYLKRAQFSGVNAAFASEGGNFPIGYPDVMVRWLPYDLYMRAWAAYSRKPEEGTDDA